MRNPDRESVFRFKRFDVINRLSAMKVGTDGVLLGAWSFRGIDIRKCGNALDVGCGSGVIALILAQRFSNWKIDGIDVVDDAVYESISNFEQSPWRDRLKAIKGDFTIMNKDYIGIYDFIISNPPYFHDGAKSPELMRSIARHEGVLNYNSLLFKSSELLNDGGRLALIAPADYEEAIISEGGIRCLYPQNICRVTTVPGKVPRRVLIEFVKGDRCVSTIEEQITIHSQSGGYSEKYTELVNELYLKF